MKGLLDNENLNEGGAMPVLVLHHTEIEPTLRKLEKELGIPLKNALVLLVKEFSGDIDIAVKLDKDGGMNSINV